MNISLQTTNNLEFPPLELLWGDPLQRFSKLSRISFWRGV